MKRVLTILVPSLALSSILLQGQLRPPYTLQLDENGVHGVPIHTEINTLLIFPEDVTLILGHHLTQGENPGKVYVQQAENAKHLILRQLEPNSIVLMQVIMNERAFVFQLKGSEEPASVIRFYTDRQLEPAVEITASDFTKTKRPVSEERQLELIRLARSASILQPRLPHEYEGFASKPVSFSSKLNDNLTATITGVARFNKEDVLIVLGHIHNDSTENLALTGKLSLKVGDQRLCQLSLLTLETKTLKPSKNTSFWAVLVGNREDNSDYIDLDNRFSLEATR